MGRALAKAGRWSRWSAMTVLCGGSPAGVSKGRLRSWAEETVSESLWAVDRRRSIRHSVAMAMQMTPAQFIVSGCGRSSRNGRRAGS